MAALYAGLASYWNAEVPFAIAVSAAPKRGGLILNTRRTISMKLERRLLLSSTDIC